MKRLGGNRNYYKGYTGGMPETSGQGEKGRGQWGGKNSSTRLKIFGWGNRQQKEEKRLKFKGSIA